ncbi:MAG TPA: UDP-N-acetylmuramoyl-tripeptide--D-alanyl-D-alanine ligase [Draconibacterium sp.]|nr:UDP-N-acetylmuramoyl-tripeptide--D-alanyl-D-alanine ligase [Draconibacterium sp.]
MTTTEEIYRIFKKNPVISTDSRKIEENCIFFALKGENFNGNKFAAAALEKGAVYAVIDEKEYFISNKTILVNNVIQALKDIANLHRKKLGIPILAITGSNGKTTTKELVSAVLSQKFKVSFTEGNLNNHIGVPLTLLKMNTKTEIGVVEMGANHPGEIAMLCEIAEPDFGIITNIGKAHLEGFGSFEGVIKTKSELYHYLKSKNGTIFYNSDNPILSNLTTGIQNKISYGKENATFTGELISSPPFVNVKANFKKGVLYLNSNLTGDYNFENIMAAACIGNHFKVDPLLIQKALKNYYPQNNRSQLINKNGLKIIMDAYNANPTSMQASIKSFISNASENNYLILGDMLELGTYSKQEHIAVLELLKNYPLTTVYTVGKNFLEIADTFNCRPFLKVEQLCEFLQETPITNGDILIKGSRGIQLEKVLACF